MAEEGQRELTPAAWGIRLCWLAAGTDGRTTTSPRASGGSTTTTVLSRLRFNSFARGPVKPRIQLLGGERVRHVQYSGATSITVAPQEVESDGKREPGVHT